jgi:serine protease Do
VVTLVIFMKVSPRYSADATAATAVMTTAPAEPSTGSGQGCDARSLSQAFVSVAAKIRPGVVTVKIEKKGGGEDDEGGMPFGPFGDMFRRFQRGGRVRPQIERGLGTGFVIDRDGHVLTNNHVVDGADRVEVETSDGRRLKGKVVGTDKKDDVAVVKVEGLNMEPLKMGDSDKLQVGELVMAIGSPFGLDQTVTMGVVSAKGRHLDGMSNPYAFEDFIQTDASINHGNSGGPLVNMNGEVVGVNSRIAGEGTGIGFSVSSNVVRRVAQALIKDGRVRRPYIGVKLQDLSPEMAPQFKADKGVIVAQVLPDSPAAKAGLVQDDVITAVDGKPALHSDVVVRAVQAHQVGQTIRVSGMRNGAPREFQLMAAEAPDDAHTKNARYSQNGEPQGKFGVHLQDLTPDIANQLGMSDKVRGAVIAEVDPGSPADRAGLRQGDVIVEVDRRPVASASAAGAALRGGSGTHLLRIDDGEQGAHYVTVSPEK